MDELSHRIGVFRECARHLWNVLLLSSRDRAGFDAVDRFEAIEKLLFNAILSCDAASLVVVPLPLLQELPVLVAHQKRGGSLYWQQRSIDIAHLPRPLEFAGFFDWDDRAHRDYQYYRVRVPSGSFEEPEMVEMLVEVRHATVMDGPT